MIPSNNSNNSNNSNKCKRCGYSSVHKHCLEKHLLRKTPCQPLISGEEGLVEKQLEEIRKNRKSSGASEQSEQSESYSQKPVCSKCGASFMHASNMYRHRKHCTGTGGNDALQTRLQLLEQKIDQLTRATVNNTTHNTSTSTTNNTNCVQIQINAFGKEDVSHVTPTMLEKCLRRTNKGLIELLQHVHFEDKTRGNANVRITNSNMRYNLAEVNDGKRWLFCRRDRVLNDMLDRGHDMMQGHWEENEENMRSNTSESLFNHIRCWMDKVAGNDKSTIEELLTDIYTIILNASS